MKFLNIAAALFALVSISGGIAAGEGISKGGSSAASAFQTIDGAHERRNPFAGTFRDWSMQSTVDSSTGEAIHTVYVIVRYGGTWRWYETASDDQGNTLDLVRLGEEMLDAECGVIAGCYFQESVAIHVDEAALREHQRTGYGVVLRARNGTVLRVEVSGAQITAQLVAIDQVRAHLQGAGPGGGATTGPRTGRPQQFNLVCANQSNSSTYSVDLATNQFLDLRSPGPPLPITRESPSAIFVAFGSTSLRIDLENGRLVALSPSGVAYAQCVPAPFTPFPNSRLPPSPSPLPSEVTQSGLGVRGIDASNYRPELRGAFIVAVTPESVAARAGIAPGDIVTSVDGQPVDSFEAMRRIVLATPQGTSRTLAVTRGNELLTVQARF